MQNIRPISALLAIALAFVVFDRCLAAEGLQAIEIPGDRAFMESITAGPDGILYVSSLASGGIARIKPGASKAEEWIAPAAFGSRSTFGVFADAESNTLWVCSNDMSGLGVDGPGHANWQSPQGLRSFDRGWQDKRPIPRQNEPLQRYDRCQRRDGRIEAHDNLALVGGYAFPPGLPWTQEYSAHRSPYGTLTHAVQGFLEGLAHHCVAPLFM
jgi:hypothetical protein